MQKRYKAIYKCLNCGKILEGEQITILGTSVPNVNNTTHCARSHLCDESCVGAAYLVRWEEINGRLDCNGN